MARPKTVVALIDKEAEEQLKVWNITISDMLFAASQKFLAQDIDIRYDLESLKIKNLSRAMPLWWRKIPLVLENFFHQHGEYRISCFIYVMRIIYLQDEVRKRVNNEYRNENPDVVLVIVGDTVLSSGFAWPQDEQKPNGQGLIIVGAHPNPNIPNTALNVLFEFAKVMMHEQGHLYGLTHIKKGPSIMAPHDGSSQFDQHSKEILQKALQEEDKTQSG